MALKGWDVHREDVAEFVRFFVSHATDDLQWSASDVLTTMLLGDRFLAERPEFNREVYRCLVDSLCENHLAHTSILASALKDPLYSAPVLSTGDPVLDATLGGGMWGIGIVEVCGESSAGKTQLGLQLAHTVQLPRRFGGLEGTCLYLCSESEFPIKRLQQMKAHFAAKWNPRLLPSKPPSWQDNIFVEYVRSLEELERLLNVRLPLQIQKDCVRLVVLDSIAGLFRIPEEPAPRPPTPGHSGGGGQADGSAAAAAASSTVEGREWAEFFTRRSSTFSQIAQQIQLLVDKFSLVFVAINQVTDFVSEEARSSSVVADRPVATSGRAVVPALGLAWSNCIQMRIALSRQSRDAMSPLRRMRIVFAPHRPPVSCNFIVDDSGIVGVEEKN